MRNNTIGWQKAEPEISTDKIKNPAGSPPQPAKVPVPAQPVPVRPQAPAQTQVQTPPRTGPRVDSRTNPSLNLDQKVEGYLLRDVVRAQRYLPQLY